VNENKWQKSCLFFTQVSITHAVSGSQVQAGKISAEDSHTRLWFALKPGEQHLAKTALVYL